MYTHYIVKGYEFFDHIYRSKSNETLQQIKKEWSHKEKVTTIYFTLDKQELDEYLENGDISTFNARSLHDTLEEVVQYMEEEENDYVIIDN